VVWRSVTPDYFRVLQIQSLKVPVLPRRNGAQRKGFVIVSKELAARMFPDSNAIGQHIEHSVFNPYRMPGRFTRSQALRQM